MRILREQAQARGIRVTVLAAGMRKRRVNTSYYNIKAHILSWRIEWIFKLEDSSHAMVADKRVDESVRVGENSVTFIKFQTMTDFCV